MKVTNKTIAVIFFSFTLLLFCLNEIAWAIKLKDQSGREVEIPDQVERVVLFECYEIVPALSAWDKVCGISRYAYENDLLKRCIPNVKDTPSPGSGFDVNMESLLALKPHVVIMWPRNPEVIKHIEGKGVPVLCIYPESFSDLYQAIRLLGKVFQREERAQEVIEIMERKVNLVRKRVQKIPPQRRIKALWLWSKPTKVAGGRGLSHDLITLAGGINQAKGIYELYPEVSLERIVAWNPDVVVIWGPAHYSACDILKDPRWQSIKAVKGGRVYKAPRESTWSPRVVLLLLKMSKWFYPELFKDIEFDKVAHKFYLRCYGIQHVAPDL
ncbi:MAG TPA: ABC transporter substrate-binding protein [Syntrophaceae bacterium]|nr:ABC transporter substrate-binding protein [Syntrophaceae bacterium]